jgi:hypothetical protein
MRMIAIATITIPPMNSCMGQNPYHERGGKGHQLVYEAWRIPIRRSRSQDATSSTRPIGR